MSIKYKKEFKYNFYPITIVINKAGIRRYCLDEWKYVYFKTLNIPDRFVFDFCCKKTITENKWRQKEEKIYLKLISTAKKFSKLKNIKIIYGDEANIDKNSLFVVENVLTSLIRKTCFNYYSPCDLGCRVDDFIAWLYEIIHNTLKTNNDYVEDKSLRAVHKSYRLHKPRFKHHWFCKNDTSEWYFKFRKETEFYDPFNYENNDITVLINEDLERWYSLDEFKLVFFKSDCPVSTFVKCKCCIPDSIFSVLERRYLTYEEKNNIFHKYIDNLPEWYQGIQKYISSYDKIKPKIVYGNLEKIKDSEFLDEFWIIRLITESCFSSDNPCCEDCPSYKIIKWMINIIYKTLKKNNHMWWEIELHFENGKFGYSIDDNEPFLDKYLSKFNDKHHCCYIEREKLMFHNF